MARGSEELVSLHARDLIIILATEGLVDVVGVSGVQSALGLVGVRITLSEDLHTGTLVLLHHFNRENVVDFDVVGGDAVVQEVGREHHVVASIPKLGLVLRVEEQDISGTNEVETRHDCHGGEAVDEETGVVQRTVRIVNETRECGSHHSVDLVDLNPVVVGDLECSAH